MNDGSRGGRFVRVPRAAVDAPSTEVTRVKFNDSLDAIGAFLLHAVNGGRDAFVHNSPAYASGSMAIVRTAALLETDEFAAYTSDLSDEARRGIITTRAIASQAGFHPMNDDLFWNTLTVHLPPYLAAWREVAQG